MAKLEGVSINEYKEVILKNNNPKPLPSQEKNFK